MLCSLWELLSSCVALDHGMTHHYTVVLYQVVSDEDSCLVHTLKASTSIFRLATQKYAFFMSKNMDVCNKDIVGNSRMSFRLKCPTAETVSPL